VECGFVEQGVIRWAVTPPNNRCPPALTTFAPGNTARVASRVGHLERYAE
jgi:hypothetical protein